MRRAFNTWLDYALDKTQKQERCHQVPYLLLLIYFLILVAVAVITCAFNCAHAAPMHHNEVCLE